MKKTLIALSLAVGVFAASQLALAGNAKTGAILANSHSCVVCHKNDLDGMSEKKISQALTEFKSGERDRPRSMVRRAQGLSDQNIQDLAAFFASR